MAGAYNKISQGSKQSDSPVRRASFINDTIDAINANKRSVLGMPGETPTPAVFPTDLAKVQNLTGSDRSRGDVVQLGEDLLSPIDFRNAWFQGNTVTDPTSKFGIIKLGIPAIDVDGTPGIGLCQVSGICTANVNVNSLSDRYASPVAGSYALNSGSSGPFEILSTLASTGSQEIWVRFRDQKNDVLIAEVNDGSTPTGNPVATIAGACVWPGSIVGFSDGTSGFCSDPWTTTPTIGGVTQTQVDVYLTIIDKPGGSGTSGLTLTQGDRYLARYLDQFTIGLTTRPLYAIERHLGGGGSSGLLYELYSELKTSDASQVNCPVISWWGRDPMAATVTVLNMLSVETGRYDFYGPTGAFGIAVWDDQASVYRIIHQEHQALYIEFTLTANVVSGNAAADVLNYWDGPNPDPLAAGITVYDTQTLFPRALTGASGIARWDSAGRQYEIIECTSKAGAVRATVVTDFTYAPTVTAYQGTQQDIQEPNAVSLTDPDNLFKRTLTGAPCIALYDATADKYLVIQAMSKAGGVKFTLTADMASGSAAASVVSGGFFGSQQDIQNPGSPITVYDSQNLFARSLNGANGIAIYDSVNDKYIVVECQSKAGLITFTLASQLTGSSSSGATVNSYGGTQQDVQSPGSTVTVYDPQGLFLNAPSGAKGEAVYDGLHDQYVIVACQRKARQITGTISGTLSAGGSQTVSISASFDGVSPGSSLTVYSAETFFSTTTTGKHCQAFYDPATDKYYFNWVEGTC